MSKFYVGQKVLVTGNSYYKDYRWRECKGEVCEVKEVLRGEDIYAIYTPEKTDYWHFNASDLEPITETPKKITLNGAIYVLKEEPKPEHEWKFGDVASHPDYGVGMVFSEPDEENDVKFANNGDWDWADIKDLTFLRRADLSV